MKVCVPVSENKGMESVPFGHFGSAPEFVICDLDSNEVKSINNGDLGHEHGKCQPLKALEGNKVDANMKTNIAGLFACGDCVGRPYSYLKSAGQGLTAALNAVDYLAKKDREK